MSKTLRDLILERQIEVAKGNLTPLRAAEILTELSALKGNILDEIRKRDQAYNIKLLRYLETEEKANRAKIKAECSDEYLQKREARDLDELVTEITRSLKYYLRAFEEDFRQSGN